MACLALSLQPLNGSDVLLQTREWFPPARAVLASQNFRAIRGDPSRGKSDLADQQTLGIGNDPVSTASGQVVVGKESRYRVVYRLVNTIYVLGITTAEQDVSNNVFECASTVNQAVSVLVAACKGIDVTSDKLIRKYTEVYMALDIVLRGVSAARLSTILASLHGEGIGQIVASATEAENRARGADNWNQIKGQSVERVNNIEVLSNSTFELPEETLAAGDEAAALLASPAQTTATVGADITEKAEEKPPVSEDPFAASDALNKPEELLGGGFKKDKEVVKDVTSELSELTVPQDNAGNTEIKGVEGFEGDYGGLDYDPADGGFGDAFEGLTDAFGGGLDPAEFGAVTEKQTRLDSQLAGLEELEGGGKESSDKMANKKVEPSDVSQTEEASETPHKVPVLWLTEEISAEFKGSGVTRAGLQGSLQLRTRPPSESEDDTEFSFSLDGAASIKKAVLRNGVAGSVGEGVYHVRTPLSKSPITLLKYRLYPQFTPLPLRLRLIKRQNPLTLSFMIQYVANPYLRGILTNVTFLVRLPFAPSTLKMSPRGFLDRNSKELKWTIPQLHAQAIPQRLRAQLPLASEFVTSQSTEDNEQQHSKQKEAKITVRVEFSCQGQSLSGLILTSPTKDSQPQFAIGDHVFKAKQFLCS